MGVDALPRWLWFGLACVILLVSLGPPGAQPARPAFELKPLPPRALDPAPAVPPVPWPPDQPAAVGAPEKNLARRMRRRVYARGIYATAYTAARGQRWEDLLHLIGQTELNAVVLDVKSDWGSVQYNTADPAALAAGAPDGTLPDLRRLLLDLRRRRIYTIARVVTFKDNYAPRRWPELGVHRAGGGLWTDYRGLTWLNPYSRAAWDYVLGIAEEVARLGFEEIQFDYVRFPSDGPMAQVVYPGADARSREQVIGDFLRYARERLEPLGVWVSADIFGIMLSVPDDQGIGQRLEEMAAGPHILSPMVYPSHYGPGNLGLPNPNADPYETVYRALRDARERLGAGAPILRPWLQDFSWGHPYGPAEVAAQIRAVRDNGIEEWLLWNAGNVYTQEGTLP